jgi:hypothetical protein
MNKVFASLRPRSLGLGSLIGLALSLASLSLSVLLPWLLAGRDAQKSLDGLRHQALLIKEEFAAIETGLRARQKSLGVSSFPYDKDKIFALFKGQEIDPDLEGLAYYDEDGNLAVWLGNVIEFRPPLLDKPLLVRSRASSFLVTCARIRQSEQIVLFRLLAFRPQLQAPFLSEYQFLDRNLWKNGHVDYWDFREDVSGFEQIFARHNDEYRGEPRQDSETQQIFFPLRNERSEIVATVNLTAPPLRSVHSRLRETMVFYSIVFLAFALVFLIADLARSVLRSPRRKAGAVAMLVLAIGALRLVFVPFSRLQKVQSLRVFSPTEAGFFSLDRLTQSPADILLSTLCLFLIVVTLTGYAWRLVRERKTALPLPAAWTINTILFGTALAVAAVYHGFISRLVANSNLNLLHFSSRPSFLFLHLGVLFFLLSCGFIVFLCFRLVRMLSLRLSAALPPLIWTPGAFFFLGRTDPGVIRLVIPLVAFALAYLISAPSFSSKKRVPVFALIFLAALLNSQELHLEGSARLGSLAQNFLHNTILAQEDWADFIIQQSLPEIEKRNTFILAFLQNPDPSPFARDLWESTLAAKFNWYSILEVLDAEGGVISRFSLNISQLYQPEMELPLSSTWRISRVSVPSLGKERDFVLAYKDWYSQDRYLGRVTFSLALDPEMLPFLYSANPYFELLKVSLLPSLNEQKFGFAIFDARGKILFNPGRISSGISALALEQVNRRPEGMWSTFRDKGRTFRAFLFGFQNRVYAFLIPRKNLMGLTVEFLKLAVFYLGLAAVILICGRSRAASTPLSLPSR